MKDRQEEKKLYGFDWDQPQPPEKEVMDLIKEIEFSQIEASPKMVEISKDVSRSFVNGETRVYSFKFAQNPAIDWYGSRHRLNEIEFPHRFLTNPSVVSALSDLTPIEDYQFKTDFKMISTLLFDAELARLEITGGAYHDHEKSDIAEIRRRTFENYALFVENRFLDFEIFETSELWAEWFHGFTVDRTYIIYDKLKREVTLFVLNDTD